MAIFAPFTLGSAGGPAYAGGDLRRPRPVMVKYSALCPPALAIALRN
jgi:hypothetical protein